jgi:LPS-assembly protein
MGDTLLLSLKKSHRILTTLIGLAFWEHSHAKPLFEMSFQEKIIIEADSIAVDREAESLTALGNVAIAQGMQFVQADRVDYYKNTGEVVAIGNVYMLDSNGHVLKAEKITLKNELKEGFIQKCGLLMSDNSRLIADHGERLPFENTQLTNVSYTPCKICQKDPKKPPLWSVAARQVSQNGTKQHITYKHAVLKFKSLPILYTPFLRHPDPSIKRQSGFLTPSTSLSKNHGFYFSTPYFWNLSPHQDMTLTPHIMTRYGPILGVEYRRHFGNGDMIFKNSIGNVKRAPNSQSSLNPKNHGLRWHVDGKVRLETTEHWRWGADLQRASDSTYLKNFRFFNLENKNNLNSRLFAEGFYSRNYAYIATSWFQGLSDKYQKDYIPLALPEMDLNLSGEPKALLKGHWFWDTNSLALHRRKGAQTQRLISRLGWQQQTISPLGDVYTLTLALRGDLYHIQKFNPNDPTYTPSSYASPTPSNQSLSGTVNNSFVGRALPQAAIDWRYPWYQTFKKSNTITIQPILGFVGAPLSRSKPQIPNEDSRLFDLDDSNLYSQNRFSGYDLLDSGSRFNYGGEIAWQNLKGGNGQVFLGQSYTFKPQAFLPDHTGLKQNYSDYVGRVDLSPSPILDFKYKFRAHKETLRLMRSDMGASVGPQMIKLKADYFYFVKNIGTGDLNNREQIRLEITTLPFEQWSFKVHTVRDLTGNGKSLEHAANVEYKNECITISSGIYNSFYYDHEVKADKGLIFRIALKNLGV